MDSENADAETYDFVHPEHKIKSDWPVLNLISKKVASELEASLLNQFQFPITVAPQVAKISKYHEIFADVSDTKILFKVSLLPMSGSAWLCVDRLLVYALAETFFGGKGDFKDAVHSPILSHTEKRLCQFFTNCIQESLPTAWSMILELQNPVIERISLDRLSHSSDDQVVAVCDYDVNIAATEFSTQLIYSHSMLEPHQDKLRKMKQQSTVTNGFSGALKTELMNCEIDMHAVLAETKISLAEFLELKSGDFIPLREIENVLFKSNSQPLFDARVGNSNGQVSASLSRWYVPGQS
ncbi:MAG: FliM/FliN family flagellar motor switch protein [Granulosicoccaceae bacterium]